MGGPPGGLSAAKLWPTVSSSALEVSKRGIVVFIARSSWEGGEEAVGQHPNGGLRTDEARKQRIAVGGGRAAVDARAVRPLEVDEQQRHRRVDEQIAEAAEHAVAVVARKRELGLAGHADEAGRPAFVRAVGPSLVVGGGAEEQRPAIDERAVFVAEVSARKLLVEPVGEAARVVAVL